MPAAYLNLRDAQATFDHATDRLAPQVIIVKPFDLNALAQPPEPPEPPAAYVVLNRALRPIVADTIDSLQDGTVNSTAPLLSTTIASEAWLRRFNVPDDEFYAPWLCRLDFL